MIEHDAPQWTANEQRMLRYMLERDGIQFFRYFFPVREGSKVVLNWHHYVIEYVLEQVLKGNINRLIINLPPGYTKTELAVINFIMRGLAINQRAKFIHASYSSDLALENSSKIKDGILSDEYQELWPCVIRTDKKGKKRWFTEKGGGMMAAAAGGQITGFRAGRMESGFTGALIVDDPLKPKDGYSNARRNAINNDFNGTMRSRLADDWLVPIIVIMQRLHDSDLSGYLLRGGSGDTWHHLNLPVDLSKLSNAYPEDFTSGVPIPVTDVLKSLHTGAGLACVRESAMKAA